MTTQLFSPPTVGVETRPDGSVLMSSTQRLMPHATNVVHAFREGSRAHPERTLVAERDHDAWRLSSWAEIRESADRVAQGLVDRKLTERPIMVLSGASADHLIITLAAYTVGVPVVPVSVAYSLQSTDHAKLKAIAEACQPGVVFADDAAFAPAAAAIEGAVTVSAAGELPGSLSMSELQSTPTDALNQKLATVDGDTIAKIMFTSGSTGKPKGVINTHRMLIANQQQMRQVWPFLTHEPPVLLDWLPWSHTFGGNHNVNMVIVNGGSIWIDDGRPVPGMIERTVRNLRDVQPTLYFNVPAGYAALVPILERDRESADLFFAKLRLGFFAAAALPQQLWERIQKLAAAHGSSMQMTTSWGLTETAPAATTTHFPTEQSNSIGVPLAGVELKLVPLGTKLELRLRGPNVTPGFYHRPDLAEAAFDSEGYLRTGDAVRFADPDDPTKGLTFDGRIAEDFKLSTGTFVSVGTLRPALLSAASGLLSDAVICGHDTDAVSALVWLHPDHAHRCATNGVPDDDLRVELRATLERLAATGAGSSQRVERLLVLTEPPQLDVGEITDKGYVNQRVVREQRATHVQALLPDSHDPRVVARQPGR